MSHSTVLLSFSIIFLVPAKCWLLLAGIYEKQALDFFVYLISIAGRTTYHGCDLLLSISITTPFTNLLNCSVTCFLKF